MEHPEWQLKPQWDIPEADRKWLSELGEPFNNPWLAQLLWQRDMRDRTTIQAFLDPNHYTPTPSWTFGEEMQWAIARLKTAHDRQEKVYIWGDFDADGLTATALLWEGLEPLLIQHQTLFYTIPNRLTESHGLSKTGLDRLAAEGCRLIITCDTGSHNLEELSYAQTLGIDVIVTDHHTLPSSRPSVTAIINPRYFSHDHPLAHLSGVAVAYKLLEALYETLPDIFDRPLDSYLDLVAIGLIADLVALKGDCRYLAQRGLAQLQQQLTTRTRPGVAKLLELCRRTGDRPTDIGFGLGPRINALSRIHGDAQDGVLLLTSQDIAQAEAIAEQAEWTNLYRKEVQRRTVQQVEAKLQYLDLSTTPIIVLSDPQWSVGILGLVASQIAQTYRRPAFLLCEERVENQVIAKGSARSFGSINLYDLLHGQSHLLLRYGGHPFAAGLSLPLENLDLFREAINQDVRQRGQLPQAETIADLALTLAEIGDGTALFKAFKLLEPFGMGNPAPCLLLRDITLVQARTHTLRDRLNQKLSYHRTSFLVQDESTSQKMPGIVWGKMAADLPQTRCDILAELDYNTSIKPNGYHLRLIATRPGSTATIAMSQNSETWILDWRKNLPVEAQQVNDVVSVQDCPHTWEELDPWAQQAKARQQKLALAYPVDATPFSASDRWQTLVGIAKYLARTGKSATLMELCDRCQLSLQTLQLCLSAVESTGFQVKQTRSRIRCKLKAHSDPSPSDSKRLQACLTAIAEEAFRQQYFQSVSVEQLQQTLDQRL